MESPSQVSDVSDDALGNMSCESSEFEDDIELEAGAAAPRAADIRPNIGRTCTSQRNQVGVTEVG